VSTLLDTNILTRSSQENHPQFAAASQAVDLLIERGERLCIVPQNLYEFWSVATRPPGDNGLGMTVGDVQARIIRFKRVLTLLRDERGILAEWERLVGLHDVKGKTAHDARLVAAMRRHGVNRLLTFNASHFARFAGITVLTPEGVLADAG
jgi:predicted nucleic acid-binding protein